MTGRYRYADSKDSCNICVLFIFSCGTEQNGRELSENVDFSSPTSLIMIGLAGWAYEDFGNYLLRIDLY
jgi:hypothetical protein